MAWKKKVEPKKKKKVEKVEEPEDEFEDDGEEEPEPEEPEPIEEKPKVKERIPHPNVIETLDIMEGNANRQLQLIGYLRNFAE